MALPSLWLALLSAAVATGNTGRREEVVEGAEEEANDVNKMMGSTRG